MAATFVQLDTSEVDPQTVEIGKTLGLLTAGNGADAAPQVNEAWFKDPLSHIQELMKTPEGNAKLFELMEELMGGPVEGSSERPGWYSINYPDPEADKGDGEDGEQPAFKSSGLHIVADADRPIAGLGIERDIAASESVTCHLFAHLPLLDVCNRQFVLGDQPLEVGLELTSTDGGRFGSGDTSFDGLKANLLLHFADSMPTVDIALKNPRLSGSELPGATADADGYVSLLDLVNQAPQQIQAWVNVALDLLTQRLQHSTANEETQTTIAAISSDLRVLLGIQPWGDLPPLAWDEVVTQGPHIFSEWLRNVMGSADSLKSWLHAFVALFNGELLDDADGGAGNVVGNGSAKTPYEIELRHPDEGLGFAITVVLQGTQLTPGIRLVSSIYEPTHGLGMRFSAQAELAAIDLASGAAKATFRQFRAVLTLLNPEGDGSAQLINYVDLGDEQKNVTIDRVEVGFSLEQDLSGFRPSFSFKGAMAGYPSGFEYDQLVSQNGAPLIQLAAALLEAYDLYKPEEWTPDDAYIVMTHRRELFDRFLAIACVLTEVDSAEKIPQGITDLINGDESLLQWLIQLFSGGGLKEPLGSLENISPNESGTLYTISIGSVLDIDFGAAEDRRLFGLWLKTGLAVSWLQADLLLGLGIDSDASDFTDVSPHFDLDLNVRMDEQWLHSLQLPALGSGPALSGRLEDGGFALSFLPAGDEQFQAVLFSAKQQPPYFCYVSDPQTPVAAEEWLEAFSGQVLLPIVSDFILGMEAVREQLVHNLLAFMDSDASLTLGELLADSGLLTLEESPDQYRLPDLAALEKIKFMDLPAEICAAVLRPILSEDEIALYKRDDGEGADGIYLQCEEDLYGLRIKMTDIQSSKASKNGSGKPNKASSTMALQLGKWGEGEDDESNWITATGGPKIKPGITLNLLQMEGDKPSFSPSLIMASVGIDVGKSGGKPLFDSHGYQVAGMQPRLYVQVGSDSHFGAAIRADEIGLPLGPKVDDSGGAGSNPVAKNLLASGSKKSGDEKEAVNPTFSATVAYLAPDHFHGEIVRDPPSQDPVVWMVVDRQFGPLYCKRIGLGFDDDGPLLLVGYDGRVALGPLSITLVDLEIGMPLKHMGDFGGYKLSLGGLDIDVNEAAIEISGGLLQSKSGSYDGELILKYKEYSLNAVGSYGTESGEPSFFVFALVTGPIGGPGFFFVTGLAAGFGYNRGLVVPTEAKDAPSFPLLTALEEDDAPTTPGDMLEKLGSAVPPMRGEYWLAAGVQFTSYEVIHSEALLVVRFGNEFEIDVLGLSRAKLPLDGPTYVYAELALLATFNPGHGLLMVKSSLTDNSYVINRECKLTGGFAFVAWFAPNVHAGDFVVTMGGYHPAFTVPDHYPLVDRLGFTWLYSPQITITGEAYFAITPSAAMAGGRLEVAFHSGALRAGLVAHADIIIYWKPFFIEAVIGIEIYISFRMELLFCTVTVHVSLSVELDFWGPPTGGNVAIDWSIISFSVGFGEPKPIDLNAALPWEEFKTMLPPAEKETAHAAEEAPPSHEPAVLSINAGSGVVGKSEDGRWLIRPRLFSFSLQSTIPVSKIGMKGAAEIYDGPALGIRPMGISDLDSQLTLTITRTKDQVEEDFSIWNYAPQKSHLPSAMWGQPLKKEHLPKTVEMVCDCLVGLGDIQHRNIHPLKGTSEFDAKNLFTYFRLETVQAYPDSENAGDSGKAYYRRFLALDENADAPTSGAPIPVKDFSGIETINTAGVMSERNLLYDAIAALGIEPSFNDSMAHMAENPIGDLLGVPMQRS